jgi:hypothetical protein
MMLNFNKKKAEGSWSEPVIREIQPDPEILAQ